MSKRITINLPDDVAAELEGVTNVSAFITEALRRNRRRERTLQMLAEAGYTPTEEGKAKWRAILEQKEAARRARLGGIARGQAA